MSDLNTILGTTKSYIEELKKWWINSIEDLLMYFPRTYESHNKWNRFSDLRWDQMNYFSAKICTKSSNPTRYWKNLYKCVIEDNEGSLAECIWFAKPYFWGFLREWKNFLFIWKAKLNFWKLQISSPKIELAWDKSIHTWEIVPVYSQIWEKLSSQWFREKINKAINYAWIFPENIPNEILEKERLIPKKEAIKQVHAPENMELLEKAQERLAFEELFFLQKWSIERKESIKTLWEKKDLIIAMNINLIKDFFSSLPFIPTNAQKIAIYQILKDKEKPFPMQRLLEWDVWSGKTLIALAAWFNTIHSWKQTALMAPTEVLARQHFNELKKYIDTFEKKHEKYINVFKPWLLIWALTPKNKKEIQEKLSKWEINFLIWTHALISENVNFNNIWLAIIDEQHRFWVAQREKLQSQWFPHTLNMTATPIPRTLALVAYWDQDISVLNEMPAWRKKIDTKIVTPSLRQQVYRMIELEIEKWRQAYVICPLVEVSEKLEVKAVTEEYERLQNDVFPKLNISFIHWKLSSKEKEEKMRNFKEKKSNILVATSVVEVWVDVPNATIMIIEWAERFWLAQLHQFRGRVWRSDHQSFCFLFTSNNQSTEKLHAMENYSDWFTLAEIDMKLRGPGEVYWIRQSWIPDLRMASFSDHKMVIRARKAAEQYLGLDGKIE